MSCEVRVCCRPLPLPLVEELSYLNIDLRLACPLFLPPANARFESTAAPVATPAALAERLLLCSCNALCAVRSSGQDRRWCTQALGDDVAATAEHGCAEGL